MKNNKFGQTKEPFFHKNRGLLLFLIFLLVLILFIVTSSRYSSATKIFASNGRLLTITGAPGELIVISVDAGGSALQGDAATRNGLTLTLNSPSHFSVQLVAPHNPDWGDTILTSSNGPDETDAIVTGSFTIPTNIDVSAQPITGQISGKVEYPGGLGLTYANQETTVTVPVRLVLVSTSTYFQTPQFPFYLVTGLGIVALLILPTLFHFYDSWRGVFPFTKPKRARRFFLASMWFIGIDVVVGITVNMLTSGAGDPIGSMIGWSLVALILAYVLSLLMMSSFERRKAVRRDRDFIHI